MDDADAAVQGAAPTPPGGPCSTRLAERDGQTLFELCARMATTHGLTSSRQAISQHLDVLEAAGLVHRRREGRYTFHDLDTAPAGAAARAVAPPRRRGPTR